MAAENKVNALVDRLNNEAQLNLQAEQEQKLKELLNVTAQKVRARRQSGKQVVEQLQQAVENNNDAQTEELLQKVRDGLRQAADGREKLLDQVDQVLQPQQRARLLVNLVQQAKDTNTAVEVLVQNLLVQTSEEN